MSAYAAFLLPRRAWSGRWRVACHDPVRRLPGLLLSTVRDARARAAARRADAGSDEQDVRRELAFLRRFVHAGTVLMEIGPRDGILAFRASAMVSRVYAVDVTEHIVRGRTPPANLTLVLSDGCSIPVPEASVDVAFSHQLMEHLDPSDAWAQLGNIYRSLAPGGVYLCVTPNRLRGCHAPGRRLDRRATGLRLLEYTAREIRWLFGAAGFADVRFYLAACGRFVRLPYRLVALFERTLEALPQTIARLIARTAPARALLGLRVAGVKRPAA